MTLRWGPTGLALGDALTQDKPEAADLLRARVRASAFQLTDESSTWQRTREEREARSLRKPMVKFEVTGDERRTRTFLEGLADAEPTESCMTAAESDARE